MVDDIVIVDETIRTLILRIYEGRESDGLVVTQIRKVLRGIKDGSIRGELARMISDGILFSERRSVEIGKNQSRAMAVYYMKSHEKKRKIKKTPFYNNRYSKSMKRIKI